MKQTDSRTPNVCSHRPQTWNLDCAKALAQVENQVCGRWEVYIRLVIEEFLLMRNSSITTCAQKIDLAKPRQIYLHTGVVNQLLNPETNPK